MLLKNIKSLKLFKIFVSGRKITWKTTLISAIFVISILAVVSPVNAQVQQESERTISDSLAEKILQKAAEKTGLPISQLELKSAESVRWSNSCMGLQAPGQRCFQVSIQGWKVVIATKQYQLTYHANNSSVFLANKTFSGFPPDKYRHPQTENDFVLPQISEPVFFPPDTSSSSPQSIPEPSFILGLMILGGLGLGSRNRSKQNKV